MVRTSLVLLLVVLVEVSHAGEMKSGLPVGEYVAAWNPVHIAGPDRGTNACPICTYLDRPMVQIFTRDDANAAALVERLEKLVAVHHQQLKGFVIVLDGTPDKLARLAREKSVLKSALCLPNSENRAQDLGEKYHINPQARNTIVVYRDYLVTANFVNLDANDFGRVEEAVRKILK